MLLDVSHVSKTVGAKALFVDVSFTISPGEKIALIGRNGQGKTTLLKMLAGEDHDFDGKIIKSKGTNITITQQEHLDDTQQSALEYILKSAPEYLQYKQIMEEYEQGKSTNITQYLEVIEHFTERKYWTLEDAVLSTLSDFHIPAERAQAELRTLSGGQKRYVEMTRMMFSRADLLLVDEPTNHMDYLGKERFISWMKSLSQSILVITHDRDVLRYVDKIIELKDQQLRVFKGNYDHFISQNTMQTLNSIKQYSDQLNKLKEAKKRVEWGLQMRAKSKEWKIRYDHWLKDYEKIKTALVKPSFWIDQNSVEDLDSKVTDSYHKFKERNIKINVSKRTKGAGELLQVRNLSLGYEQPIFRDIHFMVKDSDRVFIKGRNGAGKSTLVKTLMTMSQERQPASTLFDGEVLFEPALKIGEYQQEIADTYLDMSLEDAILSSYRHKAQDISMQEVKKLLAQYLFNPTMDGKQKVRHLSGGQKARFQLITMFIGQPELLILDEPTNHLDLPSIEELENALDMFTGGIIYISHDTYFIERMGGKVVSI